MFQFRLYVIKQILRRYRERADVHNIPKARGGLERLAARGENYLPGILYEPIQIGQMQCEWLIPAPDSDKVLLYFHGGGYAAGSINTHRGLVSDLVRQSGIRALIIDYRLAPENKFPAPLEDAQQAYDWLIGQGYRHSDIAFGGDSAGGGLCIGSLLRLKEQGRSLPACAICLSPWLDLSGSGESFQSKYHIEPMIKPEGLEVWAKNYMDHLPLDHPLASPVFYEDLSGLPPVCIQVGEEEVLLDDSLRFHAKATAAGSAVKMEVYPKQFHVFQAFWKYLPEARRANRKLAEFLKKELVVQ